MRTHRNRSAFVCWRDESLLRDVVSADTLQVARLEPVIRQMQASAGLDLLFARNGRYAVIPFIDIEALMLTEREKSPFVWPATAVESIDQRVLEQIEALVLPWIEAISLGRRCSDEQIRRFGDDDAAWTLFRSAREFGFLGAAPYRSVLRDASPYVYAVRFAPDSSISIDDPNGATGASILARHAKTVRTDLGSPERNDAAKKWFGIAAFGANVPDADVRIGPSADESASGVRIVPNAGVQAPGVRVPVATPIPYDVMVSFDTDDAPETAAFSVECKAPVAMRRPVGGYVPDPVGGSSGNILLLQREDFRQAPDADTDDVNELARRLRGEGFHVEIAGAADAVELNRFDLIHAFGLPRAARLLPYLRAAASNGIPCVVTAGLEDITVDATWGSIMSGVVYKTCTDEQSMADHLELFAQRRIEGDNLLPKGHPPYPGYEADVREVLRLANAVLVSGPAEEAFVRQQFGFTGYVAPVAPYVNNDEAMQSVDEIAGTGPFVLSHAPIHGRGNQLLLARAAMSAGLPLVILGAVSDAEQYMILREISDERVIFVPNPAPGQVEAFYRRARVFVDVSWAQYSLHRLAKAALSGCALVVSHRRYAGELWRPGLWQADPASVDSMAFALHNAWNGAIENAADVEECARRVAAGCDPVAALTGTVGAYAAASEAARLNCAPA